MSPLATRTLEIFNGAVPVFDTVITNGGLSVDTCWPLKSSFSGLTVIAGTLAGGGWKVAASPSGLVAPLMKFRLTPVPSRSARPIDQARLLLTAVHNRY